MALCTARFLLCKNHRNKPRMARITSGIPSPTPSLVEVDVPVSGVLVAVAEAAVVVLLALVVVLEEVLLTGMDDVALSQIVVGVGIADVSHVALVTHGDGEGAVH